MTDEKLLADWYEARGKRTPKLGPLAERDIVRALRARYLDLENLAPLEYCSTCQVKARGPHRTQKAA